MPVYEFSKQNGDVVELFLSFADFDRLVKDGKYTMDGGEVVTYSWDQHRLTSTVPSNYPMESDAAGVHPSQVREQIEHLRKMGCGFVEHSKDGNPIFQDKAQRKRVCEALGLFDRNASYGDPQPKYRTKNVKRYR